MPQGSHELVAYEVADGVATVTLNDPEKRNMLSGQMLAELVEAMKRAMDEGGIPGVVLMENPGVVSMLPVKGDTRTQECGGNRLVSSLPLGGGVATKPVH